MKLRRTLALIGLAGVVGVLAMAGTAFAQTPLLAPIGAGTVTKACSRTS